MGNMPKKSADFKLTLQCFSANFSYRNDLYSANANARSKSKIIICGPRRKQQIYNFSFYLSVYEANLVSDRTNQ